MFVSKSYTLAFFLQRDTGESSGSIDKGGVISTNSNMAYEMNTLPGEGGAVDDHEYEVIGRRRGNTSGLVTQGAVLDEMYEIPASDTQHPPPPPPPPLPSEATPTAATVGVACDEKKMKEGGYYNIAVLPTDNK